MQNISEGLLGSFWKLMASVKLTVVLLLSLAAGSILGTVIPQNADPETYFRVYGEFLYKLFAVFQIFDAYHSWWFQGLILFLTANIVVCSIERLSATWKVIFSKNPRFSIDRFRRLSNREAFTVQDKPENLKNRVAEVVRRRFSYSRSEGLEKGFCLFAERGRWTRLGVYVVHASIVFMLIGSLVGSFAGFEGFVNIPEGETASRIRLRNSNQMQNLDFTIRCDQFDVSYYDTGAPKEYRSKLSILEDGQTVFQKDIIVNDPIRYKGINIFQSSFGQIRPRDIQLVFVNRETGERQTATAAMNESVDLPGAQGAFILKNLKESMRVGSRIFREAFTGILTIPGKTAVEVVIPFPFPDYDIEDPKDQKMLESLQRPHFSAQAAVEEIELAITSRESGMSYTVSGKPGSRLDLPEGMGTFAIDGLEESYQFMGHDLGAAVMGTLQKPSGEKAQVALPLRFTAFDKMRKGQVVISVVDVKRGAAASAPEEMNTSSEWIVSVKNYKGHFTGLQVTKDPGVWIVYTGFILMILGCYITFFMSHQRVCVELTAEGEGTEVAVSGTANKNKLGMQRQVELLARKLSKSG